MKSITIHETATFLNKIKSKATGPQKIPNEILKILKMQSASIKLITSLQYTKELQESTAKNF